MKTVYALLGLAMTSAVIAQTTNQSSTSAAAAPNSAVGRPTMEQIFKNRDTNKDNLLSKSEVSGTRLADAFDRLDTNKDGMLGLEEFQKGRDAMRARGDGPRGQGPGAKHGQMQGERMEARFKEHDTNKDGFLSKAEFTARIDARFTALDSNKDGKLTLDEIKAGRPDAAKKAN